MNSNNLKQNHIVQYHTEKCMFDLSFCLFADHQQGSISYPKSES